MLKFYYHNSPNPAKVALFLEEAGVEYELIPIDTKTGDQHTPEYRTINPNGKTPAILDGDVRVFDSSAILLHLARNSGKFYIPESEPAHAEMLSWLMFFASGVGPYSGQAAHFKMYAPGTNEYALDRYIFEARRHWKLLDDQLGKGRYMLGDTYTILDMSVWGWGRFAQFLAGPEAAAQFPNVTRLVDEIDARPAAARARALATRFNFKEEMDDEARAHSFPGNKPAADA